MSYFPEFKPSMKSMAVTSDDPGIFCLKDVFVDILGHKLMVYNTGAQLS